MSTEIVKVNAKWLNGLEHQLNMKKRMLLAN